MEDAKEFWEAYRQMTYVDKTKQTEERLEFAINMLNKNNIEYKICNKDNGHINFLKNGKVVISFWVRTGKYYNPKTGVSDNVGIRRAIKIFKKESEEK